MESFLVWKVVNSKEKFIKTTSDEITNIMQEPFLGQNKTWTFPVNWASTRRIAIWKVTFLIMNLNEHGGALNSGLSWEKLLLIGVAAGLALTAIGSVKVGYRKHTELQAIQNKKKRKQGGANDLFSNFEFNKLQEQQKHGQRGMPNMGMGGQDDQAEQHQQIEVWKNLMVEAARQKEEGNYDDAIKFFMVAIELASKTSGLQSYLPEIFQMIIGTHLEAGNAVKAYEFASQIPPNPNEPKSAYHIKLAKYLIMGRDPRALNHLDQAEKSVPNDKDAENNIAQINSKRFLTFLVLFTFLFYSNLKDL